MSSPLIVVAGPTASGKTGLVVELATRYGGEIICADSRTIYKGMDIGTAKPTVEEQAKIPHHLLDVVEPGQPYTAADFQRDAFAAIADIRGRGKIPFLVGGTGLYIDAVVREYSWPSQALSSGSLEDLSVEKLQHMLKEQQKTLPENTQNKRHLINALKRNTAGKARDLPRENTFVVAIATEKQTLLNRIRERAEVMFALGIVDEAGRLAAQYGWDNEAMTGNIYPLIRQLLAGKITRQQAIDQFVIKDWRLAKRQLTWLRRYDFIEWYSLGDARQRIETILG